MSARNKTPFQKHREEEEAKKKRAEDETARLYQEFVESFQADNMPGSKAFIRGGIINPNDKLKMDYEGYELELALKLSSSFYALAPDSITSLTFSQIMKILA
ncbi:hypothetical protein MTR67_035943 [Solanum verrucosum]|uniref:Uncharacterized protein n=1 Tax=Solanum verrucosum TaxID=315347 RepID=A0AAF0ZLY9_SOLVR|nr:hypothetical protein MTR67_035943 [Solanum verrucosum]